MKPEYLYRINGFDQIKSFYSWLFNNQDKDINTSHVSLYLFLINQNNRSNWVEWFKLPYDLGMSGSCIGSRNTYYKCLADLQEWGLIEYKKGTNNYKAPIVKLCLFKNEQLTEQVPIPLSEQVPIPLCEHLTEPLTEHIYKLLTDNLQRITDNINEVIGFLDSREKKTTRKVPDKPADFIDQIIAEFICVHGEYEIVNRGKERAAAAKILKIYKEKYPAATSEETLVGLKTYFESCIDIPDPWLHDNMSLSLIVSKFNEINKILKHGKSGKNSGATPDQIIGAVARGLGAADGN